MHHAWLSLLKLVNYHIITLYYLRARKLKFSAKKLEMVAMTSINIRVLSLGLLLLLLSVTGSDAGMFISKVHVQVKNEIGEGVILSLHCKSKDDDLGVHALTFGSFFEFTFHPSIFGRTLYFCSMMWGKQFHYFQIYVQRRDEEVCPTHCFWSVFANGPCLQNPGFGVHHMCYKWPKGVVWTLREKSCYFPLKNDMFGYWNLHSVGYLILFFIRVYTAAIFAFSKRHFVLYIFLILSILFLSIKKNLSFFFCWIH